MPTSPLGTPRILVPAPDNERHAHLAWPKLAITSKNDLILAYSAGQSHGPHGAGCPAVSILSDGGATFSEPQILAEFAGGETYTHCGNLAIGVTKNDAVILMAMAYRGDEANSIFGWASRDAGKNWRDINVSALAGGRTGSVYGHIFQVEGRGHAVCGHYRAGSYPNESGLWISFSRDALHWSAPEQITDRSLVEPAVICVDENIVGLVRNTEDSRLNAYVALRANRRRLDWSLSESPIQSSIPTNRLPSPFVTTDPDDSSRLIALMVERAIPGNTPGRITLWTSESVGTDWTDHGTVIEFPHDEGSANTDFGYPWMVKRENGKWLMAFYFGQQSGPNSIWGLDFEI